MRRNERESVAIINSAELKGVYKCSNMTGHVIPPSGCSWDIGLFVAGNSRWWNEHGAVHVRPQHYACDRTASLGLLVGLTKWEVLGSVSVLAWPHDFSFDAYK